MDWYGKIIITVIPVFLVMMAGGFFRWRNWLQRSADDSIMKLLVNLFYPALVLKFVLGNEALSTASNVMVPPLLGFATVALGYAVAWFAGPLFGLRVGSGRRTFAFNTGMYNYGYIPIPLCLVLFDSATAGVLLVFNIGVEAAFWGLGILVVTGQWNRDFWKKLLNPVVISLFVALLLNFSGFPESGGAVYTVFKGAVDMIGVCAIPIGLLITGAVLFDLIRDGGWARHWRTPAAAVLLRLGVLPALFLVGASLLPLSRELTQVIILQAAMPAAMLPIVIARFYGGDTRVAVQVVVATTAISLFTIPLWIAFGMRTLGF